MSIPGYYECTYCGHRWRELYNFYQKKFIHCPKCKHDKIKTLIREGETFDVYGYNYKAPKAKVL